MDTRLKEKDGMQSTFSSVNVEDNLIVPIWVTLALSPLGSLIEKWTMEVIEVKKWSEWTIWLVAPLSRIQSVEQRWVVSTWEEKLNSPKKEKQPLFMAAKVEDLVLRFFPTFLCFSSWTKRENTLLREGIGSISKIYPLTVV